MSENTININTNEALKLDNQLCFPLYVCAREIINSYTPFLTEIDLTYTQYITMMVMWEEKQVLTRHLRERLYLDSGTLTPVIKKLEEKGYITKERSREDARDLIVTITKKGEELQEKAGTIPLKVGMCMAKYEHGPQLKVMLEDLMKIFKENRINNGKL